MGDVGITLSMLVFATLKPALYGRLLQQGDKELVSCGCLKGIVLSGWLALVVSETWARRCLCIATSAIATNK